MPIQDDTRTSPWTPEQNAHRSQTLRGRRFSPEHRAAIHASHRLHSKERTALWWRLYHQRLAELQLEAQLLDRLSRAEEAPQIELTEAPDLVRRMVSRSARLVVDPAELARLIRRRGLDQDQLNEISRWLHEKETAAAEA
jgi:hypothetical protein